jgi:predicted esterase
MTTEEPAEEPAAEPDDAGVSPAERFLEVPRTARYHRLGEDGAALRQLWLVCHGYGQLAADFIRAFQPIADRSRLIVAPEALNRFYTDAGTGPHGPESPVGATWMTREDRLHEIDDYVRYLDRVHADALPAGREQVDVVALGFSQGTATVARWAARTRRRVDRVVLWGAGLPPELDPSPRLFGAARLMLVVGERDRYLTAERVQREEERLRGGGLDVEVMRYEGGHRIAADALLRLARSFTPRS